MGKDKYRTFEFMYGDEVTAKIAFNYGTNEVIVENRIKDLLKTPFGCRTNLDIKDLNRFFESRSVPRTRVNIAEYLEHYGIPEYDPYKIVQKTHGVRMEDIHWIRFKEDGGLTFKEVRPDLEWAQ